VIPFRDSVMGDSIRESAQSLNWIAESEITGIESSITNHQSPIPRAHQVILRA
jgi:hypothetical protein